MHYAEIRDVDTANGPGIRTSLFVSGCNHHCKGCFNPEAWDFEYGQDFTTKELKKILDNLSKPYIMGLTILGGEPMDPKNVTEVSRLIQRVRIDYPHKSIWVYTGYTVEELMQRVQNRFIDPEIDQLVGYATSRILENIDVLVDGKFIEEEKDLKLRFKGSRNQRVINMKHFMETFGEIEEPSLPN